MPSRLLAVFLLSLFCFHASGNDYTLAIDQPHTHYIEVTAQFPTTGSPFELTMATWIPGSYLLREFSRKVESVRAMQNGEPIPIVKTAKNRWQVSPNGDGNVAVRYRVYAHEMSVRTSFVDHEFALINPSNVLMYRQETMNQPMTLRLRLPDQWSVHGAWVTAGDDRRVEAPNWDAMVDGPMLAGQTRVNAYEVGGTLHKLITVGDASQLFDQQMAIEDLAHITSEQRRFWGDFPYRGPYLFLNVLAEGRGGLEHASSTVIMASRFATRKREDYVDWLNLASHELFHAWNVKALRPTALLSYDYEHENYLKELWIVEGLTSYYASLLATRAGAITAKEYLQLLADRIHSHQLSPGWQVQSVVDSSYDAWIKAYRPDENSQNASVSYYNKGALLGWLLDVEIRLATSGRRSLDDVMRSLYQRHAASGYTNQDFQMIVNDVATEDLSAWFQAYVHGTEPLDYHRALDSYGLELVDVEPAIEQLPDDVPPEPVDPPAPALGVEWDAVDGRVVINRVRRGEAGSIYGLNVGDEILAIDGHRLTANNFDDRLGRFRVGDEVDLVISRRDRLATLAITLQAAVLDEWKLTVVENPKRKQQAWLRAWLTGVD